MRKIKLRRFNNVYRHIFEPNEIYYYEIDNLNIHNGVLYSHIVYYGKKKYYIMSFTEHNFNKVFVDIIKDRKEKIRKLSCAIT